VTKGKGNPKEDPADEAMLLFVRLNQESNFWMIKFIPRLLKRADISRFSTAVTTWHLQQSQNNY
jgi:hypothetical protein